MTCPTCGEEGRKSRVVRGPSTVTCVAAMDYYDEDGKFVHPKVNTMTTSLTCSNGHRWAERVAV